ncbi:hypothetical protein K458DRAFT_204045 [Lentithecium fluviatile CBS 122367]|uniref:Uncharacterized protein n=1 Tax=Lentithecium fluviatile CBS 122367 TaxID=1168545 RepID=A0A6G1J8J9_9PLEO|nr:hypothetical protein K458DRAFT_204045 [Lentithecium fluviatile CBS 122367]
MSKGRLVNRRGPQPSRTMTLMPTGKRERKTRIRSNHARLGRYKKQLETRKNAIAGLSQEKQRIGDGAERRAVGSHQQLTEWRLQRCRTDCTAILQRARMTEYGQSRLQHPRWRLSGGIMCAQKRRVGCLDKALISPVARLVS